jgi:hypothetical protein
MKSISVLHPLKSETVVILASQQMSNQAQKPTKLERKADQHIIPLQKPDFASPHVDVNHSATPK